MNIKGKVFLVGIIILVLSVLFPSWVDEISIWIVFGSPILFIIGFILIVKEIKKQRQDN